MEITCQIDAAYAERRCSLCEEPFRTTYRTNYMQTKITHRTQKEGNGRLKKRYK